MIARTTRDTWHGSGRPYLLPAGTLVEVQPTGRDGPINRAYWAFPLPEHADRWTAELRALAEVPAVGLDSDDITTDA